MATDHSNVKISKIRVSACPGKIRKNCIKGYAWISNSQIFYLFFFLGISKPIECVATFFNVSKLTLRKHNNHAYHM